MGEGGEERWEWGEERWGRGEELLYPEGAGGKGESTAEMDLT